MTSPAASAMRAAFQGLLTTLMAPGLLLGALLFTALSAVPFALLVEPPVMESLALQPPVSPISPSEIDAEWWQEFRRQASGLAATFTPAILGFAAPLDTASALLDGTSQPPALIVPIAVSAVVWSFLWGGVLHRFATGTSSLRAFLAASSRHFGRMIALTAIAAGVSAVLYLTLHTVLFDIVYDAVASRAGSERNAFAIRVLLYLVFGGVVVAANAVVSFARVHVAAHGERSVAAALRRAWSLVRSHLTAVAALYLLFLAVFGVAMVAYGTAELVGGSRVGGWRAVAIGQAFVAFRVGLRLALGAAQVRLASSLRGQ